MPYALRGNCVIKKDSGAVVKCHPNRKKALAHLAALEVNVSEKYSVTQPRDRLGRWAKTVGSSISSAVGHIQGARGRFQEHQVASLRKRGIKNLSVPEHKIIDSGSKALGNLLAMALGTPRLGGLAGLLTSRVLTRGIDRLSPKNRRRALKVMVNFHSLNRVYRAWQIFRIMGMSARILSNLSGAAASASVPEVAGLITAAAKAEGDDELTKYSEREVAHAMLMVLIEEYEASGETDEIGDLSKLKELSKMSTEKSITQFFSDFMIELFPALAARTTEKKAEMCPDCGKNESKDKSLCAACQAKADKKTEKAGHLSVIKQADGRLRWLMVATNAFGPDGDGEWVTEKALTDWVERFNASEKQGSIPVRSNGEPRVLRWWHMGSPDPATLSKGPGVDLGYCDFAAMHSKSLVLSGLFSNKEIAEKFSEKSSDLGVSIGFFHPVTEPVNKEFHTIDIYEVSPLPIWRASNPLTSFGVVQKEFSMISEREAELRKLAGDGPVDALFQAIEQKEGTAALAGFRHKEKPEEEAQVEETTKAVEEDAAFTKSLTEALTLAIAPISANLEKLSSQVEGLQPLQASAKETSQNLTTLAATVVKLQESLAAVEKSTKEANDGVAELKGDRPRTVSQKGFRPSLDETTVVGEEKSGPKPDPLSSFVSDFVLKS